MAVWSRSRRRPSACPSDATTSTSCSSWRRAGSSGSRSPSKKRSMLLALDPTLGWGDTVLRVVVAAALGGAIGLERELDEKAAGLRTHVLVSLGAALFTLVGAYGFSEFPRTSLDPSRIAAQVVTGIGFLGAGVIFRQGFTIRGLTTAASLWLVAAVGLAAGAGYL